MFLMNEFELGQIELSSETKEYYRIRKLFSRALKYALSDSKEESQVKEFFRTYEIPKWQNVIEYYMKFSHRKDMKISSNSLRLAKRLKKDLDLEVFPIIERTYAKFWMKSSGSFSFVMRNELCFDVGFTDTMGDLLSKKNKLEYCDFGGGAEIVTEKIR